MSDQSRGSPAPPGPHTPPRPASDPALEYDTAAEVDAAFRTQRRVALVHGVLFLLAVLAAPTLMVTLEWWSGARLVGGMSPAFLVAAGGLYVFYVLLGLAAVSLAENVEEAMLGGPDDDPWPGEPRPGDPPPGDPRPGGPLPGGPRPGGHAEAAR